MDKMEFDMTDIAPKKMQAGVRLSTMKGGITSAYIGGAIMNFAIYAFVTIAQIHFGFVSDLGGIGDFLLQGAVYFTCAYVMFLLTMAIGSEKAKKQEFFVQAKERYESLRDDIIKNHGTQINDFCQWYVQNELKAARANTLTEISMGYDEYVEKYLGKTRDELKKLNLTDKQVKVIASANRIKPVKLESWMITRSRRVSVHRMVVAPSAQEKQTKDSKIHFFISLVTTMLVSFIAVDVSKAFSIELLILALIRLVPFIINIPLGLLRGYNLYAVKECSNFEALCTLIDSANVYFEELEEKIFVTEETEK